MTHPESDELRVLRERAYGPAPDIHLDPAAVERLRELEGRRGGPEATPVAEADEGQIVVPAPASAEAAVPAPGDAPVDGPRRPPFRVRRSTVLIVLALIALIVVSYAALEIVQRVQADPLDAGATQVARLSEDAEYEAPAFFSNGSADATRVYEDFHGLRAIINDSGMGTGDKCIAIFVSGTAIDPEGNFNGPIYTGCAAGAFPAAAAFRVDPMLPAELRDAFPDGTALQFVLDESGNQIVVFADGEGAGAAARAAGPIHREFESIPAMSSRTDSSPA
jgi:hypothetical protein